MAHAKRNQEGNLWCHMMADTIGELHTFAARLNVKRCWFDRDHYDLKPRAREAAVRLGAVEITARQMVNVRRRLHGLPLLEACR